jgi:osmotically-inducible protein OsmY
MVSLRSHAGRHMNTSKRRMWFMGACLGSLLLGLGGIAAQAADSQTDELRNRVTAALHADPYFYDEHVSVSVEKGVVVLRGFVFSDWDLREALRLARTAAGDSTVVDDLSIKEGGRR